jgi:Tfp pilus assembly protein PilX
MRRFVSDIKRQDGITLIMAVAFLAVLTTTGVTLIYYADTNARSASYSGSSAVAYDLAEAGVNEVMAILSAPGNNALAPGILPTTTHSYGTGTVTWTGTLAQSVTGASTWTVVSTGKTSNPTGGTAPVTRTIRAKIPVVPTFTQPLNNPAWNYIAARGTGSSCDMNVTNSVVISSPLYVAGNLCLFNQAAISAGPLLVQGSLTMNQSQNYVGTQGVPVSEVHVRNGCKWQNNALHNPCQQGLGSQGKDNLWANRIDNQPSSVAFPTPDWNGWYLNSMPGPYWPCLQSTGIPPMFDTDQGTTPNAARRNNSLGTVQDLTPSASYSCLSSGGELSWNAQSHVLTVKGTVFIDGSAKINNGAVNTLGGTGAVYLSGTLLIKNSKLCAAVTGSGSAQTCTTAGWNPAERNIVFVVDGNGSGVAPQNQVIAGSSVQLVSAYAQGALYATNAISIDTSSQFDGPLDGSTVSLGQSTSTSWPGFSFVPVGMPGNPAVYAQPEAPQMYGG